MGQQAFSQTQRTGIQHRVRRTLSSKKVANRLFVGGLYVVLTVILVVLLIPAFWMVATSLKPVGQEFAYPTQWLPSQPQFRNYIDVLEYFPYLLYARNTMIIVIGSLTGAVLSSSLVAYSLSRLRWRGRGVVFGIVLATMMLPGIVTMIPTFIIFRQLQWINTFLPLTVPAWFGGGSFNIFLMRQFFMSLPIELDEAARMDGANGLTIWAKILLPLTKPALATITIFGFLGAWNDLMGPLLYLNDKSLMTVSIGLNLLKSTYGGVAHAVALLAYIMAGTVLTTIPVVVVFFVGQKYFVQGIVTTGFAGR